MMELVQLKEQSQSQGVQGRVEAVLGSREGCWRVKKGRSEPAALSSLLETQVQETGQPSHFRPWTTDLVVTIPSLTMKGRRSMREDESPQQSPTSVMDGVGFP